MTDHELIELAAKAAGVAMYDGLRTWNPLSDDGDALRLAVKLELNVEQDPNAVFISTIDRDMCESLKDDRLAATRRCIVRAAAEIGRQMP